MSLERAGAVIVVVDVNEAVALAHLGGGVRNQVDAAPRGIAEQVNAVGNRLALGTGPFVAV